MSTPFIQKVMALAAEDLECAAAGQLGRTEIDMLCKLIEESQREASTLMSYAGKVSASIPNNNSSKMSSDRKWSPAYNKKLDSPWGPPLPPSVGYTSSEGLWRPTSSSVVSLDVTSFLSPIM